MRPLVLGFAFLALLVSGAARAESRWFDPKLGCGPVGAFARSGKAADLPGCTGRLPKDAPQVEVVMHDLKEKLIDAEDLLARGKLDKLDPLFAEIEAGLKKTLPTHPEMPDRWEQAQRIYADAIRVLRDRRKIAGQLDGLRAAYAAAVEADRTRNQKEIEGGPADAQKAAQACSAAFGQLKGAGVDLSIAVELEKKAPPKKLEDAANECERIRKSAEGLARDQEKAQKAKRAQWRSTLKGARRKIFDEHPKLPELDEGAAVATAASWKYTTPAGVEVYAWKGNKLLRRTEQKK